MMLSPRTVLMNKHSTQYVFHQQFSHPPERLKGVAPRARRCRAGTPRRLHLGSRETAPPGTETGKPNSRNREVLHDSRVEEGRGGLRLGQSLRFPSPLIKPDVPN